MLIDDDGVGFIAYTAMKPGPGLTDHMVAIERLTPDLLHSTKVQVGHLCKKKKRKSTTSRHFMTAL